MSSDVVRCYFEWMTEPNSGGLFVKSFMSGERCVELLWDCIECGFCGEEVLRGASECAVALFKRVDGTRFWLGVSCDGLRLGEEMDVDGGGVVNKDVEVDRSVSVGVVERDVWPWGVVARGTRVLRRTGCVEQIEGVVSTGMWVRRCGEVDRWHVGMVGLLSRPRWQRKERHGLWGIGWMCTEERGRREFGGGVGVEADRAYAGSSSRAAGGLGEICAMVFLSLRVIVLALCEGRGFEWSSGREGWVCYSLKAGKENGARLRFLGQGGRDSSCGERMGSDVLRSGWRADAVIGVVRMKMKWLSALDERGRKRGAIAESWEYRLKALSALGSDGVVVRWTMVWVVSWMVLDFSRYAVDRLVDAGGCRGLAMVVDGAWGEETSGVIGEIRRVSRAWGLGCRFHLGSERACTREVLKARAGRFVVIWVVVVIHYFLGETLERYEGVRSGEEVGCGEDSRANEVVVCLGFLSALFDDSRFWRQFSGAFMSFSGGCQLSRVPGWIVVDGMDVSFLRRHNTAVLKPSRTLPQKHRSPLSSLFQPPQLERNIGRYSGGGTASVLLSNNGLIRDCDELCDLAVSMMLVVNQRAFCLKVTTCGGRSKSLDQFTFKAFHRSLGGSQRLEELAVVVVACWQ
ncbi:hypothetical protein Tco_0223316 [Tanacetum coccineum]